MIALLSLLFTILPILKSYINLIGNDFPFPSKILVEIVNGLSPFLVLGCWLYFNVRVICCVNSPAGR